MKREKVKETIIFTLLITFIALGICNMIFIINSIFVDWKQYAVYKNISLISLKKVIKYYSIQGAFTIIALIFGMWKCIQELKNVYMD